MAYIGKVPTAVPLTGADIQDGTVQLADLSATGTKDATTFLRGDNTFASAGGDNTPAFSVTKSAVQSIANDSNVLITWDTEIFDSNNGFASNKFTFPTTGKYLINAMIF